MSDDADRTKAEELFVEALDLPPRKREAFVEQAAGGDAALRDEVLQLLQGHDWAEEIVPEQVVADDTDARRFLDIGRRFVERIGNYRITGVLGAGGMGMVYLAEQENPRRLVALKIIRPGVASAKLIRRFEQEAQVLGRLQHAGIAQIHEAGTADSGEGAQPYFVMEHVRGLPLMEYAEAHDLGTRDRLALMIPLCDAVEHAHRRGIIHRDLKPGNILVTDEGHPKVLDFGVARAIDSDLQVTTIQTDIGQLIGTIPYMSPEQTTGDPDELDTRSDVYALGIVGYQLLAGRLPYDLEGKMIHEAVRVIQETDPAPLSSVNRVFRGDAETIFAKALAKEPERRYQSASELAADIGRYLGNEPIQARPPSTVYQFRKFARRNKTLVGGIVSVFVVLVAAVIIIGVYAVREGRQRMKAERIGAHLTVMLALPSPHRRGEEATVVAMLDEMVARLDAEGEPIPEVEAQVRMTIGSTYLNLGRFAEAAAQERRAVALWRSVDPRAAEMVYSLNVLGIAADSAGDPTAAEAAIREALALRRDRPDDVMGETDLERVLGNLVQLLIRQDRTAEALPVAKELVDLRRSKPGADPVMVAVATRQLALLHIDLDDLEGAEALLIESLAGARRSASDDHPLIAAMLDEIGSVRRRRGDMSGSHEAYEEAWQLVAAHRTVGSRDWMGGCLSYVDSLVAADRRDEAAVVVADACARLDAAGIPESDERVAITRARLTRVQESASDQADE